MATIAELLSRGRTLSFEFPPPKSPEAKVRFDETLKQLAEVGPSFVSVTYGALGSSRATTRDVVVQVNAEQAFPAMPHLTCVGHRRVDLVELIEHYRDHGVENILALAGDPPADGRRAAGDFAYATELIELVRELGEFSIGVAAFPEVHPRSIDKASDRRFLAEKLVLADFGITQFFFDTADYNAMVDELGGLGCDTPVLPGVFPFINVAGLRRMAALNGSHIPDSLQHRLDSVDGDPDAVRRLGIEVASELGQKLLEDGVPGLHLYTMNQAESVEAVCANLGLAS